MKACMRVLASSLLIALSPMAFADDAGSLGTQSMDHGQANVANRIASEFANLAGSKDNAIALVTGLRNGTEITLTTKAPPTDPSTGTGTGTSTGTGTGTGGSSTTSTSFTPDTGKMGWGEVKISLALAEEVLARNGITKPTAEQLQAALNGGDITVKGADGKTTTTTLKGVLELRADGMGWGKIAKTEGTTVGKALHDAKANAHVAHVDADAGSKKAPAKSVTPSKTTTVATGGAKSLPKAGPQGVVTAAGSPGTLAPKSKGITTAGGTAAGGNGHVLGKGVVTGAGTGLGATTLASAAGSGHGASGAGVVSGTGGTAGSGVTTAQGNGNGNGQGNGKGHKGGG